MLCIAVCRCCDNSFQLQAAARRSGSFADETPQELRDGASWDGKSFRKWHGTGANMTIMTCIALYRFVSFRIWWNILSHRIHVWYIYHKFMPNVGKYSSPMDPIGILKPRHGKLPRKLRQEEPRFHPRLFFWRGKNTPGGNVDFVDEIDVRLKNHLETWWELNVLVVKFVSWFIFIEFWDLCSFIYYDICSFIYILHAAYFSILPGHVLGGAACWPACTKRIVKHHF